MRIALLFGFAAGAAFLTQSVAAKEPEPGKPAIASPKAPAAPSETPPAGAGSADRVTPAGPSQRDDKAIRDAEARDRKREERMLRVTRSICRGC